MNDFEKSMFIFFDEWGGSPHFSCEHEEMYFHGVDIDELLGDMPYEDEGDLTRKMDIMGNLTLFNQLFDLGWSLTEDGESFVSSRWGSC